jgi:hypothetical protein
MKQKEDILIAIKECKREISECRKIEGKGFNMSFDEMYRFENMDSIKGFVSALEWILE